MFFSRVLLFNVEYSYFPFWGPFINRRCRLGLAVFARHRDGETPFEAREAATAAHGKAEEVEEKARSLRKH